MSEPGIATMEWGPLHHWVVTLKLAADGGLNVDARWKKGTVTTTGGRIVGPIREVSTEDNSLEIFDDKKRRLDDEKNKPEWAGSTLTLQFPLPNDLVIILPDAAQTNLPLSSQWVRKVTEMPSDPQWNLLHHWVVTLKSAADGGLNVDAQWKKNIVNTGGRRVGPIREVSTIANSLEIFDDEGSRPQDGSPPLTLQAPLPNDLVITLGTTLRSQSVSNVTGKMLPSFVIECGTPARHEALMEFYGHRGHGIKWKYVVTGRPFGTKPTTALQVYSEETRRGHLNEAAHLLFEVITRVHAEKDEQADWKEIRLKEFQAIQKRFNFNQSGGTSSYHTGGVEGHMSDWIRKANPDDRPPKPLTILFVEGISDEDFTRAAMDILRSDHDHLYVVEFSDKTGDPPSATYLEENFKLSGVTPKQLSAVDFMVLEDCDLRLLSEGSGPPFGKIHHFNGSSTTSAAYSHRWRFGRALENYLIPSVAPLALLECKPETAFAFCVEAVSKISTQIFGDASIEKKAAAKGGTSGSPWATGSVAKLVEHARGTLIGEFERKLGHRLLRRQDPGTAKHFKQELHSFLCELEKNGCGTAIAKQLAQAVVDLVPAVAVQQTPDPPGPPLQELLGEAAKILFKQKHQHVGSAPHKALCRVLFQAQEAYIDLMANPSAGANEALSQELFLCGCGCDKLLLVGVNPKKAMLGTCSCCGHKAADHNKRFDIPKVATANSEGFYAALCMSAALLWHSHDYLVAVRGELRLGGGCDGRGVAKLSSAERRELYMEHLWWLTRSAEEMKDQECMRKTEVALLDKHYSKVPKNKDLATRPVHAVALQKLCVLRERRQAELHALFARLHVDQSAAKKWNAPTADGGN